MRGGWRAEEEWKLGDRERPVGSPTPGFKIRAECVLQPPEEAVRRSRLSLRRARRTPAFAYSPHSEMLQVGFLS